MQLKAWVNASAHNLGVKPRTLWVTLYRGRLPWPPLERKNKRVVETHALPLSSVPSGVMPKARRACASPTSPAARSISSTSPPTATA